MTDEELATLEARYTAEPVPPCRVCGGELSVQSMGGGRATVYGCSNKPEGMKFTEWVDGHYRESTWTQYRSGDSEVLRLIDDRRVLADALQNLIGHWYALANEDADSRNPSGELSNNIAVAHGQGLAYEASARELSSTLEDLT